MVPGSFSGRRVGNFEIGALVGAGGMGEVYRGRDTSLNRDVAIKVLLPAVASDAERLARFKREAQTLASLNHPNIAHIHGVEQGSNGPLLVLEFVDGPTLADRIAQGPLPIDEAIAIAKQVTDALEAAHERGIVHRDLKPANIKVDDHGTVKVLDFGLAKAGDPDLTPSGPHGLADSPTITSPAMTQAGLILGTAAYMSPEQAKGRVVDKRSDVWAFGCVLYEMLTGTRAFGGEDVTDTIAAVVRGEPDWAKLPAATPSQIRLLLKRCLEKDRKVRISDIGVARFLLSETIDVTLPSAAASSRRGPLVAIAALLLGAAIGAGAWFWSSRSPAAPPAIVRFEIRAPVEQRVLPAPGGTTLAVAPDGSFMVYRAVYQDEGGQPTTMLMVRSWNNLEPRALPETRNARSPFISPDGRWIGFFGAGEIRKVPVAGGPAVSICRFLGAPGGASWGDDDHIVFASSGLEGLQRVPASGGDPVTLTNTERPKRDRHTLPHVLPGSRFVLFTLYDAATFTGALQAVEVATGAMKAVLPDAFMAAYSDTGHLVYTLSTPARSSERQARASIRAVRFDRARAEITGDSVTMIDDIPPETNVAASLGVSRRGDIVYMPDAGGATTRPPRQMVWVDRQGRETAIPAPTRSYSVARLSPDGTRVVTDVRDDSDIWVWDLNRQTFTPVNRDEGLDSVPIWMPDGRRVLWSSTRAGGNPNLFMQSADGTGAAQRLTTAALTHFPNSITADGRTVLMFGAGPSSMDLLSVTLDGPDSPITPIVATPAAEFGAELSPDGKWLAYHSNESGEDQVYVRPFPNVDGGRWQVSTAGGSRPAWSRNGRELFYLDDEDLLTAVPIRPAAGGAFSAGLPARILNVAYVAGRTTLGLDLRGYDVSPDGQRFLMIKEQQTQAETVSPRMVVILNWGEELKARLP